MSIDLQRVMFIYLSILGYLLQNFDLKSNTKVEPTAKIYIQFLLEPCIHAQLSEFDYPISLVFMKRAYLNFKTFVFRHGKIKLKRQPKSYVDSIHSCKPPLKISKQIGTVPPAAKKFPRSQIIFIRCSFSTFARFLSFLILLLTVVYSQNMQVIVYEKNISSTRHVFLPLVSSKIRLK